MTALFKVIRSSRLVHRKKQNVLTVKNEKRKTKNGFTLIELMVVIAIIAILSTVGIIVYSTAQKSGRVSKRMQDLAAIRTAVELFKASTGFYPSVPGETPGTPGWTCVENLAGVNSLTPKYLVTVPKDPIQAGTTNCYQYTSDDGSAGGTDPAGTQYKIRTNLGTNYTEMSWTDWNQQPTLLDPAHDGSIGSGTTSCTVNPLVTPPGDVSAQGWAYYTTADATCLY